MSFWMRVITGSRSVIAGSLPLQRLRSLGRRGGQRQGVKLTAHATAERPIDQLVLLDAPMPRNAGATTCAR